MKTFEELAQECTEYAVYFRRRFLILSYSGFVVSLFMFSAAIVILFFKEKKTPVADIVFGVFFVALGTWLFIEGIRDRRLARKVFKEWLKKREDLLDEAKKWRGF